MDLESSAVEIHTFDVVRRGYDRMQVTEFLMKVGESMSRLDERRKIAEVRVEQLDRELRDLRTRAEATIQETVAARARLIDSSGGATSDPIPVRERNVSAGMSNIEAQQIIQQANAQAAAIQAEADAVLEGALSTSAKINSDRRELLGSVEAERIGLIAAATAEAEVIRAAAMQRAEQDRARGAGRAQEIRSDAEADADRMIRRAEMRAKEIVAAAERRSAESLHEPAAPSRAEATLSLEDRVAKGASRADAATPEEDGDGVTVDLREESPSPSPDPATRESRTSRYKSRSANLPRMGSDAASVIGSLDSLRTKE